MIIGINKNYFRPILEKHGLWDELQVNGGLELVLVTWALV